MPKDPKTFAKLEVKEIKNRRLVMFAMSGSLLTFIVTVKRSFEKFAFSFASNFVLRKLIVYQFVICIVRVGKRIKI